MSTTSCKINHQVYMAAADSKTSGPAKLELRPSAYRKSRCTLLSLIPIHMHFAAACYLAGLKNH